MVVDINLHAFTDWNTSHKLRYTDIYIDLFNVYLEDSSSCEVELIVFDADKKEISIEDELVSEIEGAGRWCCEKSNRKPMPGTLKET